MEKVVAHLEQELNLTTKTVALLDCQVKADCAMGRETRDQLKAELARCVDYRDALKRALFVIRDGGLQ